MCVHMRRAGQRQLNLHLPLWKTDRLCLKVDYPEQPESTFSKYMIQKNQPEELKLVASVEQGDTRRVVFITRIVRYIVNLLH